MTEHSRINGIDHDVVIAGGGLAGLCLAKQLRDTHPQLSVVVFERTRSPLPVSAFKVGESTVEIGAYYLSDVIGLHDYLEEAQLEKLGLRYFYGAAGGLADEPEFGVREFLPAKSYQLDRGSLEDHLRGMVVDSGAVLRQGVDVTDIRLGEGEDPHRVDYRTSRADTEQSTVTCRWVIDATGRRRLLQRKLGLGRRFPKRHNAVWFRLADRLDIDDLVEPEAASWHDRVVGPRWNSTNHFMFEGGWAWLIPLSAGHTSVGIVVADAIHPIERFNRIESAQNFVAHRIPLVADAMREMEVLDFHVLRDYSHSSSKAFSTDRWACVGEAVAFADPYYSVGTNLIGYANGFVTRMIGDDLRGALDDEFVAYANRWFLSLAESLTNNIQLAYPFHHRAAIMALKTVWDYYVGWAFSDPQFYDRTYLDPAASATLSGLGSRAVALQTRVMDLLTEWSARYRGTLRFSYIDYHRDLPTLARLFVQNLPAAAPRPFDEVLASVRDGLDRLEELAHVIFYLAVEDVLPEHRDEVRSPEWLNVNAIGLDPVRWRTDGLFSPITRPRPDRLRALEREMSGLFDRPPARADGLPVASGRAPGQQRGVTAAPAARRSFRGGR